MFFAAADVWLSSVNEKVKKWDLTLCALSIRQASSLKITTLSTLL